MSHYYYLRPFWFSLSQESASIVDEISFYHSCRHGCSSPTQLAPARLAATAGRTQAARVDDALDRLAAEHTEVATDSPADSGDSDEALDALCEESESENPSIHHRREVRYAQLVMKGIRKHRR